MLQFQNYIKYNILLFRTDKKYLFDPAATEQLNLFVKNKIILSVCDFVSAVI